MNPKEIVDRMFLNDAFSQWLGVKIDDVDLGKCTICMEVTKKMTNGFEISHGGIAYSLADSCAAFTANSFGLVAITQNSSIRYAQKVSNGDKLSASCKTTAENKRNLEVIITNQNHEVVADYTCTIYYTKKEWKS